MLLCAGAAAPATRDTRKTIEVFFWVSGGEQIHQSAIAASVNGKSAPVVGLLEPASDLVLLLVLDMVGDLSQVSPAQDALARQLAELPPNVLVGLLRAQDGLRVLTDPSADRERLVQEIRTLAVSGRAGLLDTVETVMRIGDSILSASRVRVAVLYVTDSDVTNYREDFTNPVVNSSDTRDLTRRFPQSLVRDKIAKLSSSISATQTPLFIVHLHYRNDALNEAYQTGLLELSSNSGGRAEFSRTLADIPEMIGSAFRAALGLYSAEIALPQGAGRQLSVSLVTAGRTINHRTRFQLREK